MKSYIVLSRGVENADDFFAERVTEEELIKRLEPYHEDENADDDFDEDDEENEPTSYDDIGWASSWQEASDDIFYMLLPDIEPLDIKPFKKMAIKNLVKKIK